MPTIRVSIQVQLDGSPVANFPLFSRSSPTIVEGITKTQPSGIAFFTLPNTAVGTVQHAIVQSDQQVNVAVNGATGSPFILSAGGILCLLGTSLTTIALQNQSGSTANISGLIGGF